MADKIYIVEGRQYRTEMDYRKALRDQKIIDTLRAETDLNDADSLRTLIREIKQGEKYRFHTLLGEDFLEELEDKLRKLPMVTTTGKKKGKVQQPSNNRRKKKSFDEVQMEKFVLQELRRRERRRKLMLGLCGAVGSFCLFYFGYYAYEGYRTEQNFEQMSEIKEQVEKDIALGVYEEEPVQITYTQDKEAPEVLDEYKKLFNMNKKLIGWLKIDDTNIDYPVVQTSDNVYYLTHNINQEEDRNGTLFLDAECDVINGSTNYIIYGHDMRSGNMFGKLDKYKKESYYQEHKYITFDTIYEKATYEVMYAFESKVYKQEDVDFKYYQFIDAYSEVEFNSYMKEMASWSLYDTGVTASYGDQLLTLSTCDKSVMANGRFVVVAKRVK
ncbi:MAG: class B sortase [Lachnospiraceae bacterium]|nr:class B sortase [Lachnospiraceae bacterium]